MEDWRSPVVRDDSQILVSLVDDTRNMIRKGTFLNLILHVGRLFDEELEVALVATDLGAAPHSL